MKTKTIEDQGHAFGGWTNVAATPCGLSVGRSEEREAVGHRASMPWCHDQPDFVRRRIEFLRPGSNCCEMWAMAGDTSMLRHGNGPPAARRDSRSCHRAGKPARLTMCRTPRRSAISRSFAPVVAKTRPSNRPSPCFSIRFCRLWALQFSRTEIPGRSFGQR
jgi:hypothetical protein